MDIQDIMKYDKHTGIAIRLIDSGSRGKKGVEVGKVISLNGEKIYKHRAIWLYMTGELPSKQVIFIDGDKNNFKWDNLELNEHSKVATERKSAETRYTPDLEIRCNKCYEWKPGTLEFYEGRKDSNLGFRANCRECIKKLKKEYNTSDRGKFTKKNTSLLYTYGIELVDYNIMFKKQKGKCAICGTTKPHSSRDDEYFAVDHNHTTGEVRGLLCDKCNRGIGMLDENIEVLSNAIAYLNNKGSKHI